MGFRGLGTVTHRLVEDVRHLPTAGKAVSQIEGMQHSVLCSSVQILRGHWQPEPLWDLLLVTNR